MKPGDLYPVIAGSLVALGLGTSIAPIIGAGLIGYSLANLLGGTGVERKMTQIFENRGFCVTTDETKVYPKLLKKEKTDYGYKLTYRLPLGISEVELWKLWEGIELGTNSEIEIYSDSGLVHIKFYTKELPKESQWTEWEPREGIIPIVFGKSRAGLECFDLAKAPHLLIGGETGGGKTTLLRVIAANILNKGGIELHAIDLTRKLGYLKEHAWFASDYDEVYNIVNYLKAEMIRRYQEFDKMGIDEIEYLPNEYEFPRVVLLIDEFNALSPSLVMGDPEAKSMRSAIVNGIAELITRGRGCGIHLVIGLQRPDAKIMSDGQIKNSMPVRISFRTFDASNSRIILENDMASMIPADIPGRCVFRGKDRSRQVQVFNLDYFEAKDNLPKEKAERKVYIPPNPLAFLLE